MRYRSWVATATLFVMACADTPTQIERDVTAPVSGASSSLVGPATLLLIDEESIDKGTPPNFFSDVDVNDHIADIGLRTQLPFFAANVGSLITLHTGEVDDEGWFAVTTIPDSWASAGPTPDGLDNYVAAGPGLGSGDDPEALLDKIPDVTPLRATGLKWLEGQRICAVVYDSDISIDYDPLNGSLKGANLGTVAFEVVSVTPLTGASLPSLPKVEIRILDADYVCSGGTGTPGRGIRGGFGWRDRHGG